MKYLLEIDEDHAKVIMEKNMKEEQFNTEIERLTDIIQDGNISEKKRAELLKLKEETKQRHQDLKDSMHQLQDSLDTLRLYIKYILFDTEATKRENAYLKKMLNNDRDTEEPSV